jgi:lipopolysaccharide export system ATP-binding protein
MMVGLVALDAASCSWTSKTLTPYRRFTGRARLGCPTSPGSLDIPQTHVAENIRAVLELRELEEDSIHTQLDSLLHDLHIALLRNSPAISLSGGERRRVEIARPSPPNRDSSCSTSRSRGRSDRGARHPENNPIFKGA